MNKISIRNNDKLDIEVVEAFDMLRTNIGLVSPQAKAIVVTSSCAKEGKSLISFQLASNMANNGKRTLLVMADYRKDVSGKSNDVLGMSEALKGMAGLNDTVFKTDIKNMYLMFAGSNVTGIEDLIKGVSFDKMLEVLKKKFDFVIFDTAPVLEGAATSLICSKSDGTVLIAEQEKTRYDVIFQAKEQIELSGSKVLGVVLNNPV